MHVTNIAAGGRVPDVEFRLLSGKTVNPANFKGQKLVIFFCDGSDPLPCSRRLHSFADLATEFEHCGTWIIGLVSNPGRPGSLPDSDPPIVALALDPDDVVGAAFGLRPGDEEDGKSRVGRELTTFLIDRDGTVDRIWRNSSEEDQASEVLEAARKLT
jgi:peroxiredoxin Q/BCP